MDTGGPMARRASENQDLLGLVAIGSLVTNLAQSHDSVRKDAELLRLRDMFLHLRQRYSLVCQEYGRMRDLNTQLQSMVASQRADINRLVAERGAKG